MTWLKNCGRARQDSRGAPPLEWSVDDTLIEWYAIDAVDATAQFSIELKRGAETWQSPVLGLK
jgi:hypothetical protein